mmetsp:Transcript_81195/g.165376  ORF Transcript_81195/g.165376 Transcript_81195/m.165376 type:complete len:240 (-) Transcript_81195:54-773(-)
MFDFKRVVASYQNSFHLWKNFADWKCPGLLALRRAHGSGAALVQDLRIFTAELTLLAAAALALALHAVRHGLGLGVLAALRRFHGMPVIIAAGGHALGVLTAQLALLAPAALAALLHAGLHGFLPDTLQAFGAIDTLTRIFGAGLAHGGLVAPAAALLDRSVLSAQLTRFSSASLAADIDAGGHTALDGLHVLTAQLALLTATAAALLFDAIAHGLCNTSSDKQGEHENTRSEGHRKGL